MILVKLRKAAIMTIFRHTRATRTVVSALALAGVLLLTVATGGFAACTSDAAGGGAGTTTTVVCTVSNSC